MQLTKLVAADKASKSSREMCMIQNTENLCSSYKLFVVVF